MFTIARWYAAPETGENNTHASEKQMITNLKYKEATEKK
jgi:hypothetical protein